MNIIYYTDNKLKVKDIINARDKLGADQYLWVYFGSDQDVLQSLVSLCGDKKRLKLGNAFHAFAREIRPKYLEYLSNLSKLNQSSVLWWASGMASKSPFMSQFFKLVCYRELIIKLTKQHDNLLVLIEDQSLFQTMKDSFVDGEILFVGYDQHQTIRLFVKGLKKRIWLIFYFMLIKFKIIALPEIDLRSIYNLLFSWVNPGSYKKNGKFIDYYLGDLKAYLEEKGHTAARLTFSFFPYRQVKDILNTQEAFIVPMKYLSFWDIIVSAATIFHFKQDDLRWFMGVDISRLLQREIFQENANAEFIKNLIFYNGLCKIFKKSCNLRTVFHPFEGQPWEKMLAMAANEVDPKIKVYGYQHSSFASMDLNYYLGPDEIDINPLPDIVLTNSEFNLKRLIAGGFQSSRVASIGTLRYSHLFEHNNRAMPERENSFSVLVCLPYSSVIASEMLSEVLPVLYKVKTLGMLSKILIKPHPLVLFDFSSINGGAIAEVVSGELEEQLHDCDIMIYSNGTVGIEGLYEGKKLIKYLPELELDLDPLAPLENSFSIRICCRGEFNNVLPDVISNNYSSDHRTLNMFDPVDYNKIDKLVAGRELSQCYSQ